MTFSLINFLQPHMHNVFNFDLNLGTTRFEPFGLYRTSDFPTAILIEISNKCK